MEEIRRYAPEGITVVLAGNRCGDTLKKSVDYATAKRFADARNLTLFEVDARLNTNITECFMELVSQIMKREVYNPLAFVPLESNNKTVLSSSPKTSKLKCFT